MLKSRLNSFDSEWDSNCFLFTVQVYHFASLTPFNEFFVTFAVAVVLIMMMPLICCDVKFQLFIR